MPIEFIGMVGARPAYELDRPLLSIPGEAIDPTYVRKFTRLHEESGFDRVLIGYGSTGPDGFIIASYAAEMTEHLGFLIAHKPGFISPTLAARKAATLDQFTNGRIALLIITGGNDAEQQRDGDWLDHDARYRRTDEYLQIVRRLWTSDAPFDYEGEFYKVKDSFSEVKPRQKPYIPLYFGGASDAAVIVGAKHSNTYAMWGEPLAAIKERIAQVKAAAPVGQSLKFSISLRLILGETEDKAWEQAYSILSRIKETRAALRSKAQESHTNATLYPQAVGSQRLLKFAAESEIHDKRLWTPIASETGGYGSTTALVGTPEQVAESLIDYYEAGVTTFLIRGFNPVDDAITYGRNLIPIVRTEVLRKDLST